jgi:hypothetical protein
VLSPDVTELNCRAGYQPGRGYVHAVEAASEILDEALEPFMRDLERRVALGMTSAAIELAVGILLGLYECRQSGSETLLKHSPDFAVERAAHVTAQCAKLRIALPREELLTLLPEWDGIVD